MNSNVNEFVSVFDDGLSVEIRLSHLARHDFNPTGKFVLTSAPVYSCIYIYITGFSWNRGWERILCVCVCVLNRHRICMDSAIL